MRIFVDLSQLALTGGLFLFLGLVSSSHERRAIMPLIINVGVSRKASKDFQSAGYSLNPTAELDQGLLGILLG